MPFAMPFAANALSKKAINTIIFSSLIFCGSAPSLMFSPLAGSQPLRQTPAPQTASPLAPQIAPQLGSKLSAPATSLGGPLMQRPTVPGAVAGPIDHKGKRPPSIAPLLTVMTPVAGQHLKMTSTENDKTFTRRITFRVSMPMSASEAGYDCCSIGAINIPNAETISATQEIKQFPVQKTDKGVPYYSYSIEVTLKQPITVKQRVAFKVMAAKNGVFDESTAQIVSFPIGGN